MSISLRVSGFHFFSTVMSPGNHRLLTILERTYKVIGLERKMGRTHYCGVFSFKRSVEKGKKKVSRQWDEVDR